MRTPHLVPLSKQALAILKQIKQFCGEHELIFIGDHDPRKPMSENTVNSALHFYQKSQIALDSSYLYHHQLVLLINSQEFQNS